MTDEQTPQEVATPAPTRAEIEAAMNVALQQFQASSAAIGRFHEALDPDEGWFDPHTALTLLAHANVVMDAVLERIVEEDEPDGRDPGADAPEGPPEPGGDS